MRVALLHYICTAGIAFMISVNSSKTWSWHERQNHRRSRSVRCSWGSSSPLTPCCQPTSSSTRPFCKLMTSARDSLFSSGHFSKDLNSVVRRSCSGEWMCFCKWTIRFFWTLNLSLKCILNRYQLCIVLLIVAFIILSIIRYIIINNK